MALSLTDFAVRSHKSGDPSLVMVKIKASVADVGTLQEFFTNLGQAPIQVYGGYSTTRADFPKDVWETLLTTPPPKIDYSRWATLDLEELPPLVRTFAMIKMHQRFKLICEELDL